MLPYNIFSGIQARFNKKGPVYGANISAGRSNLASLPWLNPEKHHYISPVLTCWNLLRQLGFTFIEQN
jgi:hypothetical protein